ncbi:hypothetical protein LOC71_23120 [Rhodopirellula sp. JC740]|uniref:Uncharacterized protein n=1 Tax=Rhodopirellula halodulae TaxID=2894198 RepID=A0ABS8NNN7_9BACT|nr:hypothetical protein [Rhodopirellula sp. JC740]MCC9645181.1 hypothetical protein [Rhodopirellula sp. JC740]
MNDPTELESEFCLEGWGKAPPRSRTGKTTRSQPPRPQKQTPKRRQAFRVRLDGPAKEWLALNAAWIFTAIFSTLSVCGWLFNFFMNPL